MPRGRKRDIDLIDTGQDSKIKKDDLASRPSNEPETTLDSVNQIEVQNIKRSEFILCFKLLIVLTKIQEADEQEDDGFPKSTTSDFVNRPNPKEQKPADDVTKQHNSATASTSSCSNQFSPASLAPHELAQRFLFTADGSRTIPYAQNKELIREFLAERKEIKVDHLTEAALLARGTDKEMQLLTLAGYGLIINRELDRLYDIVNYSSRSSKSNGVHTTEVSLLPTSRFNHDAVLTLSPLTSLIHELSGETCDLATAALAGPLPNVSTVNSIVTQLVSNVLHSIFDEHPDSLVLTAATSNTTYVRLHHDFIFNLVDIIAAATNLQTCVADAQQQMKQRANIGKMVRSQSINFFDNKRKAFVKTNSKSELQALLRRVHDRKLLDPTEGIVFPNGDEDSQESQNIEDDE
ncbi:unnamed protein product [Caenorhabditis auriculariae]|uniref:Uncharacterized protein n=1 Tax=Caenorhabditis auriculariae TaxID=2777116 RepID=A0A8S1H669_9PELO|nr:unnamed protein product [Caenorhabditis auriculariae]